MTYLSLVIQKNKHILSQILIVLTEMHYMF